MSIENAYQDKKKLPVNFSALPANRPTTGAAHCRVEVDGERVRNGLAQLVLTVVKLLHELLERQAIRRMDSNSLTDEEIERLGLTLMQQAEELDRLREAFGFAEDDLNIDLGPLGQLL